MNNNNKNNIGEKNKIPFSPQLQIERAEYSASEGTLDSPQDKAQGTGICTNLQPRI